MRCYARYAIAVLHRGARKAPKINKNRPHHAESESEEKKKIGAKIPEL
jgi:hypothetical protein